MKNFARPSLSALVILASLSAGIMAQASELVQTPQIFKKAIEHFENKEIQERSYETAYHFEAGLRWIDVQIATIQGSQNLLKVTDKQALNDQLSELIRSETVELQGQLDKLKNEFAFSLQVKNLFNGTKNGLLITDRAEILNLLKYINRDCSVTEQNGIFTFSGPDAEYRIIDLFPQLGEAKVEITAIRARSALYDILTLKSFNATDLMPITDEGLLVNVDSDSLTDDSDLPVMMGTQSTGDLITFEILTKDGIVATIPYDMQGDYIATSHRGAVFKGKITNSYQFWKNGNDDLSIRCELKVLRQSEFN